MEDQLSLFKDNLEPLQETWVCQKTVMLGSNHLITTGDKVIVINRYKDLWLNLNMIVVLHNSKRIESIESFFIKHFYILRGRK